MESKVCTHTTRGVWGHAPPPSPRKILNLDPLRLLLTQSGARLLFNICDKTIIAILNFKMSGAGPPSVLNPACSEGEEAASF